jgi:nucleoporin SEH1
MQGDESFQAFGHGHHDLVLAVDFNFYGNRMVTAGSDQKLKVWDRNGDEWQIVDSWKAHNAEITDVRSGHHRHANNRTDDLR